MNPTPQQQAMANGMKYVFPPIVFLTTAWLPAGLQWFFICLTGTTMIQTTATLNPAIRRWADIPPLPKEEKDPSGLVWQAPTKRPAKGDGIMASVKKNVKEAMGQDEEKKAWEAAQDYEARRAAEEKEKTARRLEEARQKRSRKRR